MVDSYRDPTSVVAISKHGSNKKVKKIEYFGVKTVCSSCNESRSYIKEEKTCPHCNASKSVASAIWFMIIVCITIGALLAVFP